MGRNPIAKAQLTRFRIALLLAVAADALQFVFLPFLVEGADSPADDGIDAVTAVVLIYLLGFHWEFLPSFAAKLLPGVDLVPLWTLSVANVYRQTKRLAASQATQQEGAPPQEQGPIAS